LSEAPARKARKEVIKQVIESSNVTAEDIKNMMRMISYYYYYRTEILGDRPEDVALDVFPDPRDVANVSALIAAWKIAQDKLMSLLAKNLQGLTSATIPADAFRSPEKLAYYLFLQQRLKQMETGPSEEELEEFEASVDMERLKRSLEKVKGGKRDADSNTQPGGT